MACGILESGYSRVGQGLGVQVGSVCLLLLVPHSHASAGGAGQREHCRVAQAGPGGDAESAASSGYSVAKCQNSSRQPVLW